MLFRKGHGIANDARGRICLDRIEQEDIKASFAEAIQRFANEPGIDHSPVRNENGALHAITHQLANPRGTSTLKSHFRRRHERKIHRSAPYLNSTNSSSSMKHLL